ncbi:HAD family hydrolase [Robertmurraya massiliosenegalensis]|uniref:hypothetical protein n=1 Tax=Robertmurraya massiliosenegalensis TaxID=1287657 RepID=UPI000313D3E8|nr:hypothetical protein [Robertmurraya massiliosenegalensis]
MSNNDEFNTLNVSTLSKTWIMDIDGTIVKHNGYKIDGKDTLLSGAKEFFQNLSDEDNIIFVTSRSEKYKEVTEEFLDSQGIRFNQIIYDVPYGERILINDKKPSGLLTAHAINTLRDKFCETKFIVNRDL